jgi:hypothetical protein
MAGVAVTAALAALVPCAAAQQLGDPTRPPPGFYSGAGNGAGSGAGAGEAGLVLQSVMISDSGRSAIIDGEHILVGGKVAGGRLIKVSETEAVVLLGNGRHTLKLFPGVQKHETAPAGNGVGEQQ